MKCALIEHKGYIAFIPNNNQEELVQLSNTLKIRGSKRAERLYSVRVVYVHKETGQDFSLSELTIITSSHLGYFSYLIWEKNSNTHRQHNKRLDFKIKSKLVFMNCQKHQITEQSAILFIQVIPNCWFSKKTFINPQQKEALFIISLLDNTEHIIHIHNSTYCRTCSFLRMTHPFPPSFLLDFKTPFISSNDGDNDRKFGTGNIFWELKI